MARSTRETTKRIADFGYKQFEETGATAVEVLRVKASTMRKHFKKLQGITYLVGVIHRDRIRVYFFNSLGMMLVGENVEVETYKKVRVASRHIARFEKPREPTPEELRMEATEELRNALSRSIKRVSRALAVAEPEFPEIYVTDEKLGETTQSFGLDFVEHAFLFQKSMTNSDLIEGITNRAALLLHVNANARCIAEASCLGNAVAFSLLKKSKKTWLNEWIRHTKETKFVSLVSHFIQNTETYADTGFKEILKVIDHISPKTKHSDILDVIAWLHSRIELSLGTEDYHTLNLFCKDLKSLEKLSNRSHSSAKIHLSPRTLCNPVPIDIHLGITLDDHQASEKWLEASIYVKNKCQVLSVVPNTGEELIGLEYLLQVEDIFPKPSGINLHSNDLIRRALSKLGIVYEPPPTFSTSIKFQQINLEADERAVLARLATGNQKVLSDSLIGSPSRIESLISKGAVCFAPDFNHIGLRPNFLVIGNHDSVRSLAYEYSLESTILESAEQSYGLMSTCPQVSGDFLTACGGLGLEVRPVASASSFRRLIRHETTYQDNEEQIDWAWSTG